MQYTAQQLGSALGVALVGAIVLSGLVSNFVTRLADDPAIPAEVIARAEVTTSGEVSFASSDQVRVAATDAGIAPDVVDDVVGGYEAAQLLSPKDGLLVAAALALAALPMTRGLPSERPGPAPRDATSSRTEPAGRRRVRTGHGGARLP